MAIVFDAVSEGNTGAGTSLTVSHTCTGANRILWAAIFTTGNDTITGATYNAVAMTQAVKFTTSSSQTAYLYYLVAPATGANNIVASNSTTENLTIVGMSFTGAKQTGVPDATASAGGSGTAASTNLTTVADNSFGVYCSRFNTGTRSAGTGMTIAGGSSLPATGGYTTNAKTPAGTQTMSENSSASAIWGIVAASFAPSTSTDSTMVASLGSFVFTGVAALFNFRVTMPTTVGTYALTGIDVALGRGMSMVASVGAFILTGIDIGFRFPIRWLNQDKNSATITNPIVKHNASVINVSQSNT